MKIRNFITLIAVSASLIALVSCQTLPISELNQEDGISRIREDYKDSMWSDVISSVDEYKTRYPYSKFNVEADLMQADAYYQAGRYPEAIAAYEDFIRKNPNNNSVSLAHYRIATSYDFQAPEAIDKEQLNAKKAISKYLYYLKNFSNSENIKEAKERIEILTRRLADHEAFVAHFYWRKDLYAAALIRYQSIIKTYSQYADLKNEAFEKGSKCYENLADLLEENPKSDEFITFKNVTSDELRKKAQEFKNQ